MSCKVTLCDTGHHLCLRMAFIILILLRLLVSRLATGLWTKCDTLYVSSSYVTRCLVIWSSVHNIVFTDNYGYTCFVWIGLGRKVMFIFFVLGTIYFYEIRYNIFGTQIGRCGTKNHLLRHTFFFGPAWIIFSIMKPARSFIITVSR